MADSINNNVQYDIDALPTELQLYICEYLPTDTLRLLFELNKHWKNTLVTFYGKCRYLAIDSYQNTLWALSRFRQIETISLRSGYTPSDNILTDIATSKSCTRIKKADLSVPKYSLKVPVVNHGLRALAESPSCATLETLNLNVSTIKTFTQSHCAPSGIIFIVAGTNVTVTASIRSLLRATHEIQSLDVVTAEFCR